MFRTSVLYCGRASNFSPLTLNNTLGIRPTKIQAAGSIINNKISRTALFLNKSDGIKSCRLNYYSDLKNSHESEWRSVVDGIDYSLKKEEHSLLLENSSLDVMNCLVNRNRPLGRYIYYYDYIFEMQVNFDYLAVRWIPRALNNAHNLLR